MASESVEELLFFDTFSHDATGEINLDLVQFPKPVIISEIRIIPLGARVQADFPGGVRLGATNPSQFKIDFFVNDLSKPEASTFERLGVLEYKQNVDIQLECGQKKILTDGLVLKGLYTTITLAVYGILNKGIPPPAPIVPERRANDISVSNATAEWVQQHAQVGDQSQEALYMDQSYNYSSEYQQGSQEHNYVEGWPVADVPPPNVPLQHNEGYQPGNKKYEAPQSWDAGKTWEHPPENSTKPEHIGSPVRSLNSDSRDWTEKKEDEKEKIRSRDDRDKYWDENTEVRDEREHSRVRDDRIVRSDKDSERDDRSRDRRSDKERDWRRRDDGDDRERDRYAREKERKEREGSVKDDLNRDRSKCLKERERSSLRDERTSSRGRRERERSIDRPSWREKSLESDLRHRSSKSFRESSWERERERDRERERERERDRDRERERERERERNRDRSPCSDASSYRKRLKSPPTRSPRRPHTPTERFWSPDTRGEYNSPTGRQMYHELHEERRRSPVASPHSKLHSPQTPVLSPAKYGRTEKNGQSPNYGQSPVVQDEPSLDDEQFEPILSDEDIIDESDSQYQDMDYDFPDDMEEIVKPFNPFTFTVQPLEYFVDPSLTPCEKEQLVRRKLKLNKDGNELIQMYNLVKGVSLEDPSNIKEDWVQAVEQLLPLLDKGLASVAPDHPIIPILLKWVDVGLDLDIAICHSQPAFKVRHIKAGIRLTDGICSCGASFVDELVVRCRVQQKLLQLFHKEYMALSIKLMILKALDSTFISENSLKLFLREEFTLDVGNSTTDRLNGYQHLFRILEEKQLVRVKFAITSLIKKIHTHEMLENLRKHMEETVKVEECEYDSEVLMYLKEMEKVYLNADSMISQPKRFLPVESQFEINISSASNFMFLYKFFKIHKVLEILLILLSNRKTNTSIVTMVQNLIRHFSDKQDGLAFLSSNQEVTNNILKALCCQTSEEYIEVIPGTTTYLGMEITCRLQVLQHLDRIVCLENKDEVFDILHELYSISFTSIGKLQIAFVLSLEDNLQVLLDLLQNNDEKSAVRNYVFDLLIMTVKYSDDVSFLRKFGKKLLELAESDKQSHLHDVVQWLKPLEISNIISYEDITPLCDILKKHTTLDGCASLPGDLITCVRILRFLGIPKNESDLGVLPYEEENTELKYKYVILQLYSSDCLSHLNAILTKILEFYEQPFVHSINLLGMQGSNLLSFVEPCIMLMRRMLTYVISVRNNEYKDLTHVNVLIQVFTLMQAYQPNSECFPNSQKVCRDIVETLLAYTQPVADENASETETFTKSLWTLMISDVLKYITKSSFTFIPGFLLLSELLPLPTPIPSKSELTKEEINQIINSRKLWSAHLHTLSLTIHDLIATMAGSSYAPLLQLVRRVCLQLADLAAPTALVVCRAVLDPLLTSLQKPQTDNQTGVFWEVPCLPQALRLLNFLACLVSHSSIKAAVLSLLTVSGVKSDEKYLSLVNVFAIVLRTPSSVVTHTQVQEHVILIMQALFDSDVTLMPASAVPSTEDVSPNEVFMANALPPKDLLITFVNALLDHIANQEHSFLTILSALKALMLLTEHDYGFFHLKNCLESKSEALWNVLEKISNNVSKENNDSLSALCTALDFMRELVNVGEDVEMSGLPPRSMTISSQELANAVRWDAAEGEKPHPISQLETLLKEWSTGDESFISLHENLEGLVKLLSAGGEKMAEEKEASEIVLPAPMPLNAQFSSRPVYVIGDVDDKKLYSVYWLSLPTCDDSDQEMDQIGCDLIEFTNSVLPDYLLPHEVERICMLKTTDDEEDPKKQQTSKYHFSGAKTRRPFITPMRGRGLGRAAPQRGDLFRSRPPNTSRPPSLHVDDFVALETCGQQPTGPTGYNKISMRAVKDIIATRTRGRGGRVYPTERGRFFGAPTYPRRESPRGLLRGRGSWLQHEEAARQFHLSERLPLRTEATLGRFLGRGRALPPWSTRSEQFGGIPIRSIRSEPSRHLRTFIRATGRTRWQQDEHYIKKWIRLGQQDEHLIKVRMHLGQQDEHVGKGTNEERQQDENGDNR